MKKHLQLLLLLAALALPWVTQAQPTVVTVGTGTSSSYNAPFNNYYKNSYDQMTYSGYRLASAGLAAGNITTLGYNVAATGTWTMDELTIYMGITTDTIVTGTAVSALVPMADLTQVYHATNVSVPSQTGWFQITLDTPFPYDPNVGSLVIVVSKKASAYSSALKFYYTNVANSLAYRRNDSDPSYADFPTSAITRDYVLPNIQLTVDTTVSLCFAPNGFAASDVSANSISISWNANDNNNYQVAIDDATNTFDPSTASWISTTNPYYTFSGLTPATTYNVYLRSDCGNGLYSNISTLNLTTTAISATIPYVCDFENTEAGNWMLTNGTCTNQWVIDTAAHYGENSHHALYISNGTDATGFPYEYTQNSATAVFAYRTITIPENGQYDVMFDWYANGESTCDFIRAAFVPASITLTAGTTAFTGLTATTTPDGWVAIDGGGKLNLASAWQQQRTAVPLSAGTYNLVFYWRNDASAGTQPPAAIDNISIVASACPGIDSVDWVTTETTATITAFTNSTPSEYMLIVSGRGTAYADTVFSYSNIINLTDIPSGTYYDATIYTICGSDTTLANYDFNFKTDCGVISQFPWDYGFENATWFQYTSGSTNVRWPYCWNAVNGGGSTTYVWKNTSTVSYCHSGAAAMYFYSTTTVATQADLNEWLITPTIDLTGNDQLSFWVRSSSSTTTANYHVRMAVKVSDEDDFGYDTASLSQYVAVPLSGGATCNGGYYTDMTGTTYVQYFADLRGLSGQRRIAFVVDTNCFTFYMDDLRLVTVSNCPDAINVRANGFTATTASVAWGDTASNPTTSSWDLYYGPEGFDADTVTSVTVYDTTYTIENLMPQTTYEFFVIAHCSDGSDANATTRVSFTTACAPVPTDSLPYVEDFEAYGTGTTSPISPCWTKFYSAGVTYPYPYGTTPITGNRSLYFYSSSSNYCYAAMPMFETDITNLRLRFNVKAYSTLSTSYGSVLVIGVMSNPNDIATFDTIQTVDLSNGETNAVRNVEMFFDTYNGDGSYIAFLAPLTGPYAFTTNYVKLDDVTVDLIPSCRRSTMLAAENVATNSADLYWHNGSDNIANFQVAYSTEADFNPATCTNTMTVYDTTATLTNLSAYTRYYWSVKANCDENAEWSDVSTFMTVFDCGTGNVINILDTIGTGTTGSYSYPFYAYHSSTASSNYPFGQSYILFTAQELAEMGLLSNNTINGISLQCGTSGGGTIDGISIYMVETDLEQFSSTPASDTVPTADMQLVFSGSKTFTAGRWEEIVLDSVFNYTGNHNLLMLLRRDSSVNSSVYFNYYTTTGRYNVAYSYQSSPTVTRNCSRVTSRPNMAFNICTTIPNCERPDSVSIADLQATSAQITWVGSAANYEVAYGATGFDPDSTDGTHQVVSTNNFALANLTAQTSYDFYVRSLCSNPTDTSDWTLVTHFTTPCLPQPLPFSEDFEAYGSGSTATIDPCWVKATNNTTQYPYPYSTNAITGSRSLYFYAYRPSSATSAQYYSYVALPMMAAPVDSLQISFNMRRYSTTSDIYTSRLVVGLMTDPSDISTFTPVDTIDLKDEPSLSVHGVEVNFAGHTNEGQFIAIYDEVPPLYGTSTYTYSYVYVDDIVVDYIPSCPRSSNVTVVDSLIGSTSATVAWTDRATAALGYELEYGPAGFVLGQGTRIQSMTNPTTISGLSGSTTYDVYVRPICSATDTGAWSFPVQFATSCVSISQLPFTMDFEDEATGSSAELPLCWTRLNDASGTVNYYPYINSSTSYAHSGSKYLYFYASTTSTYADHQIMSLPEVDTNVIAMNSLELHFWGHGYTSSTSYVSELVIGVMSNPNVLSTFVPVDTIDMTSATLEYVVDFSNYHGNGSYVSIMCPKLSTTNYAYVDDITLQQVPDCLPVYDITVTGLDTNMIAIAWTDSVNSSWTVEYGPEGFTPGTGTTATTLTTDFTLNNLATNTRYTFIVTPVCSGLVYSTTATFRTSEPYYNVPFNCNFENTAMNSMWNLKNGTNRNAWNFGTATNNGGTNSLYISQDNGTSYTYDLSTAGVSFAYVNLNLLAGDYEYSFDWKAQGESTYDYLRVALIPASEELEAISGTTVPSGMSATAVPDSWISLHGTGKLNLDSTWTTVSDVMTLPAGIYHLAFVWRNDGGGGSNPPAAIDNILFNRSTCARPTNIQISNLTQTSATISWTETGTATQWEYTLDGTTFEPATSTTVNLTGLNASSNYEFGVRSICAIGDTSLLITATFATLCDYASAADTLREDFEFYPGVAYNAAGGVLPNCWESWTNGTDPNYTPHICNTGSFYYTHSGTHSLVMTSGSGTTYGNTKVVRLPIFSEPVNSLTVSYWLCTESSSYGTFYVGYLTGTNLETDFVAVKTIPASNATYHSTSATSGQQPEGIGLFDTVSFENAPDSAMYIAFKWEHNSTYYSCSLDDIVVTADISCPKPTIASTTPTYQDAVVMWNGNGANYEAAIRPATQAAYPDAVTIQGNTYTFTGLQPATQYFFRVRQDCSADSNGYSEWAESSFTTDSLPCFAPTNLHMTDATNVTATLAWNNGSTETAWEIHVWRSDYDQVYEVTTNPATVTGLTVGTEYSAAIRALCGTAHDIYGEYGDTITFTTAVCDPVTNVNASASGTSITVTWTAGANNCGNFEIDYGFAGAGQGEGLGVIAINNGATSYTFNGLEEETAYRFLIRAVCADGWVSVWSNAATATTEAAGDECGVPTNVTATANGLNVTVTFTAGENNTGNWQIEYGPAGFDHGQGQTVTTNTTTKLIEGLNARTAYDFYVRAICSADNYSAWSGVATATTGEGQGIYDVEGNFNCNIFPNPATDETTISVTGVNGQVTIAVVDMNGRTVSSETLDCAADCVKKMNVSGLAQGTYFVRIYGENVNSVKKLIVR